MIEPTTPASNIVSKSLVPSSSGFAVATITKESFLIASLAAAMFSSSFKKIGVIINGYKKRSSSIIIGKSAGNDFLSVIFNCFSFYSNIPLYQGSSGFIICASFKDEFSSFSL